MAINDERTRGQAILPDAHGGTMVDDGISHRAPPPEGVAPQVDPIDNAFFELFNGRLRNECLNVPIHVDRRCEAEDRSVAH